MVKVINFLGPVGNKIALTTNIYVMSSFLFF